MQFLRDVEGAGAAKTARLRVTCHSVLTRDVKSARHDEPRTHHDHKALPGRVSGWRVTSLMFGPFRHEACVGISDSVKSRQQDASF